MSQWALECPECPRRPGMEEPQNEGGVGVPLSAITSCYRASLRALY